MAGTAARGGTVTAITAAERTLGAAVDAFLAQPRPVTTARTYTRTLERLAGELGRDRPLAGITDEDLDGAASRLWGGLAPRTWNRHLATVGSFLAWCRRHGWPAGNLQLRADRRAAPEDDTRAIPLPELERLWARTDIPLRERALWRLLYDSAARAEEALGLDVRRPRPGQPAGPGPHQGRPCPAAALPDRRRPAAGQAHRGTPGRAGVPHRPPGRRAPGDGRRRPGPGQRPGPAVV